ncbi:MAG TPA: hypothetical protein VM662_14880 [Sphingomonas sp.]|nr:hypothetical protein [Sphingomonas sp.]
MTPGFFRVFADAAVLWRSERELLARMAGVFFFLPMLAVVLLIASSGFGREVTPEQFREALLAFQSANFLPLLLASIALDFGTFAVLNLLLQGGGRTLGEVLRMSLLRFLPFVAITIVAGALFSLGLSLFVLPGLFAFARTWLAAPAYAAAPQRGPFVALAEGWRRSRGWTWLLILAATGAVLVPALFVAMLAAALFAAIGVPTGMSQAAEIAAHLTAAAIAAFAWTRLAVLRVAFYRLTGASSGT